MPLMRARACREIGEPPPHTWAPPARAPHGELTPLREQGLKAGRGASLPLHGGDAARLSTPRELKCPSGHPRMCCWGCSAVG